MKAVEIEPLRRVAAGHARPQHRRFFCSRVIATLIYNSVHISMIAFERKID